MTGADELPKLFQMIFEKGRNAQPNETIVVEQHVTRSRPEYRRWLKNNTKG